MPKPTDDRALQGTLNELGGYSTASGVASDRRNEMGADMARRQALSMDGAVEGAGNFVYRRMGDGSITVLHDPKGAATGVNLSTGEAFNQIDAELKAKGFPNPMEFAESPGDGRVPAEDLGLMSADRQEIIQLGAQSNPGVSASEAEKMRSDAIAMEQGRVESEVHPTEGERFADQPLDTVEQKMERLGTLERLLTNADSLGITLDQRELMALEAFELAGGHDQPLRSREGGLPHVDTRMTPFDPTGFQKQDAARVRKAASQALVSNPAEGFQRLRDTLQARGGEQLDMPSEQTSSGAYWDARSGKDREGKGYNSPTAMFDRSREQGREPAEATRAFRSTITPEEEAGLYRATLPAPARNPTDALREAGDQAGFPETPDTSQMDMTPAPGGDFNPWRDEMAQRMVDESQPRGRVISIPPGPEGEHLLPENYDADTATGADTGIEAEAALNLPAGDPRREAALEAALRKQMGR
jgi:hypothetical protein